MIVTSRSYSRVSWRVGVLSLLLLATSSLGLLGCELSTSPYAPAVSRLNDLSKQAHAEGRNEEALSFLKSAHSLMPQEGRILYNMGVIAAQQGQYEASVQWLSEAAEAFEEHKEKHGIWNKRKQVAQHALTLLAEHRYPTPAGEPALSKSEEARLIAMLTPYAAWEMKR